VWMCASRERLYHVIGAFEVGETLQLLDSNRKALISMNRILSDLRMHLLRFRCLDGPTDGWMDRWSERAAAASSYVAVRGRRRSLGVNLDQLEIHWYP